jgi:lipid-A-disaccharide synthase
MKALQREDPQAQFRFFGGDLMAAVGGTLVRHYRELAYMGVIPVLLHLPSILKGMSLCKHDIAAWQPHAVILVDYPGFNLKIAKWVKARTQIPVYYYIAPKIWAWKEYRIKNIRRDVDELFSILPFEVSFFEHKHHYPIHYVGNPTAAEVHAFQQEYRESRTDFCRRNHLGDKPLIALLAGSRQQEIKNNLPLMLRAASHYPDYQPVIAGAPGIDDRFYDEILHDSPDLGAPALVRGQTYALLTHAHAALVTSGTATLETALFRVPQVVCYATILPALVGWLRQRVLKVKYISLVNLIANREVVAELVADGLTLSNLVSHLGSLLQASSRQPMLSGYDEVARLLGGQKAPEQAAHIITRLLSRTSP